MRKEKFTPGPWELTGFEGGRLAEVRVERHLACLLHSFSKRATDEDVANAHLISAAPDLYAALVDALDELQIVCLQLSGEDYNNPRINAALSKARGEEV